MSHGARRGETRVEPFAFRFLSALILFVLPSIGLSQTITEYPVPTPASALSSITAGPDGALWFAEKDGHKIGRITPAGVITEFDLPAGANSPSDIAAGSDGNLWYTSDWSLCRMTPAGETACNMVGLYGPLKHIVRGPDGALWFTSESWRIGRALPSGAVNFFSASGVGEVNRIGTGPDGNLWYSMLGGEWVGRMTTAGAISEFPLPHHPTADQGIASGPDGAVWFGSDAGVTRFTLPDAEQHWSTKSFPTGPATDVTFDDLGNLWFTGGEGLVGRLTPQGVVDHFGAGSAARITKGTDGNLWFIEPFANKIGRVSTGTVAPTCTSDDHTLCLNDHRFAVNATFQQTPLGPSIEANAVRLTADTGYFWFFDANNVELVVKVLNGCGLTNTYWVFAAGLTNVGVNLTVRDTRSGVLMRTYENPIGTPFVPIQDTGAFSSCP